MNTKSIGLSLVAAGLCLSLAVAPPLFAACMCTTCAGAQCSSDDCCQTSGCDCFCGPCDSGGGDGDEGPPAEEEQRT